MSGFINKKSRSWTEYFNLWGAKWKRKFAVLTNVGLVLFDENKMRKPSSFICLLGVELIE